MAANGTEEDRSKTPRQTRPVAALWVCLLVGCSLSMASAQEDEPFYEDVTATHLPPRGLDPSMDAGVADIDGDGDLDLLLGSEGRNSLLINNGTEFFIDESEARIPVRQGREETRKADFGDVDGDGDLDIYFANVDLFVFGANPQNRLLLNNGKGFYTDETDERLPVDRLSAFEIELTDLDGDGDLDALTANAFGTEIYRAFINDGRGFFSHGSNELFGGDVPGPGFDVEQADFDNDGLVDLYLASRLGTDRLLLGRRILGSGIPCADVKRFKVKKCRNGRIRSQVVLRSKGHAGRSVSITFGGETTLSSQVKGKRTKLTTVGFELGLHSVELTDPAGCFPPRNKICAE